jgi:hypothetical protein
MLANREDKPFLPLAQQDSELAAASTNQADDIDAFAAAAGKTFWRRRWRMGPVGARINKTVAEVRAALDGATNPGTAQATAERLAKDAGLPPGVPNGARNLVRAMPQTAEWSGTFSELGYAPYVHVGDADAVTLKATENTDGTGDERSLFSRYDDLVADHAGAIVLSGGYRFAHRPPPAALAPPEAVPVVAEEGAAVPEAVAEAPPEPYPHAAGAGGDAEALMARTQQAVKTSELDMSVRAAMQGSGVTPYLPEPNLIVRAEMYNAPGVGFGRTGPEWFKLQASLRAEQRMRYGVAQFAALAGTRVDLASGGVLWSFAAVHRPRLVAAVGPRAVRVFESRCGSRTIQDPTRVVVFRDQATIEAGLARAEWQPNPDDVVFDQSAALVTDVGRFDKPYVDSGGAPADARDRVHSGTNYVADETDPLALFDRTRAAQSHAKCNAVRVRVAHAYGLLVEEDIEWVERALKVLLPQSLFAALSDTNQRNGTLSARTTAARDKLAEVQPELNHFAAFTEAVSAEIANPAELAQRARTLRGHRTAKLRFSDKTLAVVDRLTTRGVNGQFLNLLSDQNLIDIWDSATAAHKPPELAAVTASLKAVGDAIAEFLSTY